MIESVGFSEKPPIGAQYSEFHPITSLSLLKADETEELLHVWKEILRTDGRRK